MSILIVAVLLGLMTLGFILLEKAEPIAAELSSKLSKVWVFAEIILFVFIGMGVNLQSGINAGLIGIRTFSPRLLEVRLSEESARFTKR
jgi:NhaP-type Na+/H+ or K+/H+ antiporter